MPVKIKRAKKGKQAKGKRIASAPTRDVIINISTSRPRARGIVAKPIPKRSEDLTGRLKDFEISQQLFKQTKMMKETADKLGIFDKRLSVLAGMINGDKPPPLFFTPPTQAEQQAQERNKELARAKKKQDDLMAEAGDSLEEQERKKRMNEEFKKGEKGQREDERQREDEGEAPPPPTQDKDKKKRGRKPLTAEEKRQRELKKIEDRLLTTALNTGARQEAKREAQEPMREDE